MPPPISDIPARIEPPPLCNDLAPLCLLAAPANQTASQSVQHWAILSARPRVAFALSTALSCVPEVTDAEEVTDSNPVSPPTIPPVRGVCDTFYRLRSIHVVDFLASQTANLTDVQFRFMHQLPRQEQLARSAYRPSLDPDPLIRRS